MGVNMTGRLKLKGRVRGLKREAILASGWDLIYQQGFRATGVKDITDAAGVPKGSFYNYFDSKAEFGLECLRTYEEFWAREVEAALRQSGEPPLERIKNWYRRSIEEVVEKGYTRGCLAGNLAQELGDTAPAFREVLARVFERFQRYIAECLAEAQAAGDLSMEFQPEELASFILNSWQGALLRMKAQGTEEPLRTFEHVVLDQLLK